MDGKKVRGSMDPEEIRKVIRSHADQVRACYEKRLAKHPADYGKLTLKWQINADGRVSNAVVRRELTTFSGDDLPACIIVHLADWQFPKPTGGGIAIVTFPWVLRVGPADFESECQKGNGSSCNEAGRNYDLALDGVAKDAAHAARFYGRACDLAYAWGCSNLGYLYAHGVGVAKDSAHAVSLYERACSRENAVACYDLASYYEHGEVLAKDTARAVLLYGKACDGGHAGGCEGSTRLGAPRPPPPDALDGGMPEMKPLP